MKVIATLTLRAGNPNAYHHVAPGETLHLPKDEASECLARGFALPFHATENPKTEWHNAIVDAIDDVPKDAFGKEGKPSVKALEHILDQPISAADRDSAWEAYQALQLNEQ